MLEFKELRRQKLILFVKDMNLTILEFKIINLKQLKNCSINLITVNFACKKKNIIIIDRRKLKIAKGIKCAII